MGAFLAGPVGSFARVFVSALLGAWLLSLTDTGEISFSAWETWVVTALVSAIPVVIAALNPSDTRFGNGS